MTDRNDPAHESDERVVASADGAGTGSGRNGPGRGGPGRSGPARLVPRSAQVRAIARTELRRRWRSLSGNTGQLLAMGFVALFAVPLSLAGVAGAYLAGGAVAEGEVAALGVATAGVAVAWVTVAAFGGYRAYATALRPDRLDGTLTTVSHRELLGGLVAAELLLWGAPTLVLGGAAAAAFAAGAGSPPAAPLVVVTLALVLSSALACGFLIALTVMNAGVRSVWLTRLRTALLAILGVAYFGVLVTGAFETVLGPLVEVLAPTPVGWGGHLALLGTDPDASGLRAAGAVLASATFALASWPALTRLAEALWYADGVTVEREPVDDQSTATATADESVLAAVLPRPVLGVVAADWKRARRKPIALSYVVYPLFVLVGPLTTTFQEGHVGSGLVLWIALAGPWITGALFSLNVVGFEGAALPTTLLGPSPGRSLVVGHVAAGALLGVPATLAAVLGLGALGPHGPGAVATLTASALVLAVCAGPIASGVGVVFPRFEAVSVSRGTKAVVPSMFAFAAYSIVVSLVALPALLGHSLFVRGAISSAFGASEFTVGAAGSLLTAVLAVLVGAGSAYYAIRSVEGYQLD